MSARFSFNEYVVGFDPLNEPAVSSRYAEPSLYLPKKFDHEKLQPMYAKIYEKYYNNNPDNIMMFEPAQSSDIIQKFGGIVNHLGFTVPPGGEIGSDKHVLNDHTYCCQMGGDVCATG